MHRTFFEPDTGKFSQSDQASPLQGWDLKRLIRYGSGYSQNDLREQLYVYLHELLQDFALRLQSDMVFSFEVRGRATNSPTYEDSKAVLDRIDTAQLSEHNKVRLRPLLLSLGSTLKLRNENANATLITIFEGEWHEKTVKNLGGEVTKKQVNENLARLNNCG